MTFHSGDQVECIDASGTRHLKKGRRYTVTSSTGRHGEIGYILISNGGPADGGWFPDRFRLAVHKTDISALKALLVPGTKILVGV
jgi:hypothetical protein